MADNLVSKFTVNSQGTDIDVKIKDADARNLIAQEISDRNSAITTVTNNLNKEISDRKSADTTITNNLNKEINDRESADTTITNNLNKEINDRENADTALKAEVDILKSQMQKNHGRNFILVGDSFGGGIDGNNNSQAVDGGGWIDRFKASVSGYCNVYSNQVPLGGVYGFASSRPFLDVFKDAEKTVTDKNSITDIIVLGGTNDASSSGNLSAVPQAIEEFCNYCHTNYKNARIGIGIIGALTYEFVNNGVYDAYKTCVNHGAYFINSTMMLYSWAKYLGADGTHLTKEGYEFYQPYVNQAILTGKCYYEWHGYMRATNPIGEELTEATTDKFYTTVNIIITPETTRFKMLLAKFNTLDGFDIVQTVPFVKTTGPQNLDTFNVICNLVPHWPLYSSENSIIYANYDNTLIPWYGFHNVAFNDRIYGSSEEIVSLNVTNPASQPCVTFLTGVMNTACNYLKLTEQ